jgi:glycosyltransferase involved in cell wall biosynthesis
MTGAETVAIVTARDEAARVGATLAALAGALPQAAVTLADDGSSDATAQIARAAGAKVLSCAAPLGKGGAASRAAAAALHTPSDADLAGGLVVLLCDADLGESAGELGALVDTVRSERADLAVASFARRQGGGFGLAVGFARWAVRRCCGRSLAAPLSGQRAISGAALADLLPFAAGFGMELGMTIDALRAGYRVVEVELNLDHRVTGRTPGGFVHRARQLRDLVRAYAARR